MKIDFLGNRLPRLAAPLFPSVLWRGKATDEINAPQIYLTFDDGPHPESTPVLLEQLSEKGLPAVFFLTGQKAHQHPDLVQAIKKQKHVLANHGWDHSDPWRTSSERTITSIERTNSLLIGHNCKPLFVRPPYGRFTPSILRWVRNNNQKVVLWDVMPGDFLNTSVADMCKRLRKYSRPGSIVVLHDNPRCISHATQLIEELCEFVAERQWTFGQSFGI